MTIAGGAFSAPSVWDCGCSPFTCDTLVINHSLTHPIDMLLNAEVHLTSSGQLAVAGDLTLTGSVINEGAVNVDILSLGDSASFIWNSGLLNADRLLLNADSNLNTGTINVFDTLRVGPESRLTNTGNCAGHFLWTAFTTNSGELLFDRIGINGEVRNTGLMRGEWSMVVFDTLYNDPGGYLDTDTLLVNGAVRNNTFLNSRRRLEINTWGVFDAGLTGQAFCNGMFINYGVVQGNGDLCIQGMSYNYGNITGSPDICDVTLVVSGPPYLDYNGGNIGPNVNWCPSANCSSLGLSVVNGTASLTAAPNPATDRITINGLSGSGPWSVQLFDMEGRGHAIRSEDQGEGVVLFRGDLAAGCYTLVISTDEAKLRSVARVVFMDP